MNRLIRPYDFILDSQSGWRVLQAEGASVESGRLQTEPLPGTRIALTDASLTFGGLVLPRGVTIWGDEIFISDPPRHRILHWRTCCGAAKPLPTIGGSESSLEQPDPTEEACSIPEESGAPAKRNAPRQLDTPLGLTINHRDDLVIVDSENRRLLLFTLPGLALRRIIGPFMFPAPGEGANETETIEWQPVDVAAGPAGTLYVADAIGVIRRLDSQGRLDAKYPGLLPEGRVPVRVLADCEQRAYVIVEDSEEIAMFNRYGRRIPSIAELAVHVDAWLDTHGLPSTEAAWLALHGLASTDENLAKARTAIAQNRALARAKILPEKLSRDMDTWMRERSLDTTISQNQREAYARLLPGFLREMLPASRLSLDGDRLLLKQADPHACRRPPLQTDLYVDGSGRLLQNGLASNPWLLRRVPRTEFKREGIFRIKPLDSSRNGNPWHRIVLEQEIPERTGIRLFSLTSDVLRPEIVDVAGLASEPPDPGPWQVAPDNAGEWLIQSPPGRYLYLAIVLKGPGDRTPAIDRIYIYAHRQSSLRYLPAVYQADETSRSVLDRLLSLYDTIFGEIESKIEDFPRLLDVEGTPLDFLPWLASWFDLSLEQVWNTRQKRDFLKNIMALYRWRGTVRGLRLLLQLHTGVDGPLPHMVEHFRGIANPSLKTWLGEPVTEDVGHHFTILLPGYTIDSPEKRLIVQRLVDANKPAHTHYTLRPVSAGLRLGAETACGSALGLDSQIGSHGSWHLPADSESNAILGGRTVLPDIPMPRSALIRLGYSRLAIAKRGCRSCSPCEEP